MQATLTLVPSARHVDEAATEGAGAERPGARKPYSSYVRQTFERLLPNAALAEPEACLVAARLALKPSEREVRGPSLASAQHFDDLLGHVRRSALDSASLRKGSPFAAQVAERMAAVDALLNERSLVDPRGMGLVSARAMQRASPSGAAEALDEVRHGLRVQGMVELCPDDVIWMEGMHRSLRRAGLPGVSLALPKLAFEEASVARVAERLEATWALLEDAPEIDWQNTGKITPCGTICARSAEGEARAICYEVAKALETASFERIAIAVPNFSAEFMGPLRAALDDAAIPFFEMRGAPLSSSPDVCTGLSLLELAAGQLTRDRLTEVLRSPAITKAAFFQGQTDVQAEHAASVLAYRIEQLPVELDTNGKLFLAALLDSALAPQDMATAVRALERVISMLRYVGEAKTAAQTIERVLRLWSDLKLGEPGARDLGAAIGSLGGYGDLMLRSLGESARAVRAVRQYLEGVASGLERFGSTSLPSSIAELVEAVHGLCERRAVPPSPAGRALAVQIGRPGDLCGQRFDLVCAAQLCEGWDANGEQGRTLMDERLGIESAGRLQLSSRDRQACRRTELAWLLSDAGRVVASFSQGSTERPETPDRLLTWLEAQGTPVHTEPASRVAAYASAVTKKQARLVALAQGIRPPERSYAHQIERARSAFFLDPNAPASRFTGFIDTVDPRLAKHLQQCVGGHTAETALAVTAVERAAGCGFAAFAKRVLRARKSDSPTEMGDGRERGTLLHLALRATFEALRGAEPQLDARVEEVARAAVGYSDRAPLLRRELLDQVVRDALMVASHTLLSGDPLRFVLAEQSFGSAAAQASTAWEALELRDPEDQTAPPVFVAGQIDRIDRSADGQRVRVVDYKTGRLPDKEEQELTRLQLPLYAAVAGRALQATSVSALYVVVRPRGQVELWPRESEKQVDLASSRERAAEIARRAIGKQWQGDVAPRPVLAKLCAHCDVRDVCRRPAICPSEEA